MFVENDVTLKNHYYLCVQFEVFDLFEKSGGASTIFVVFWQG